MHPLQVIPGRAAGLQLMISDNKYKFLPSLIWRMMNVAPAIRLV